MLDIIKTADFEVIITDLTANGDGSYKGTGRAMVPWFKLAGIRVKFSDIKVNQDLRVFSGNVTTIYSKDSRFVLSADLSSDDPEAPDTGSPTAPPAFNGMDTVLTVPITNVTIPSGNNAVIVVTTPTGQTFEIPRERNEDGTFRDTRITDANGDTWTVSSGGDIQRGPNVAPPPAYASRDSVNFRVNFAALENQYYGFDSKHFQEVAEDKININGEDYWIAWKSVETGRQDYVSATASGQTTFPAKVGFKTSNGPAMHETGSSAAFRRVSVMGLVDQQVEALTAYVRVQEGQNTEEVQVGRLNVKAYDKVQKKVIVVPVNNASVPAASAISEQLNNIYAQAVVGWEVIVEPSITVEESVIQNLDAGVSGMLSSFPENMMSFVRTFRNDVNRFIDGDAYYIFMVNNPNAGRAGFMPFNRKFGFVYTNKSTNVITTLAHELGHGAFNLRHTFSPEAMLAAEGTTDNLMDYNNGTKLKKYQWDLVRNQETINGWFEDDRESSMFSLNWVPSGFFNSDESITFLSPAGTPITLPKSVKGVKVFHGLPSINYKSIVTGTLFSFTIGNETYQLKFENGSYSYFDSNGVAYNANESTSLTPQWGIWVLPYTKTQIKIYKVRLPSTSSGVSGVVKDETQFPIVFEPNSIIGEPATSDIARVGSSFFVGNQQFLTEEEVNLFASERENKAFPIVVKIAQLRNMYPSFFNDFANLEFWGEYDKLSSIDLVSYQARGGPGIQIGKIWDNYVVANNLQSKFTSEGKFEFYSIFLREFILHLSTASQQNLSFWQTLSAANTKLEVVTAIERASENEIKTLNANSIRLALSIIIRDSQPLLAGIYEREEAAIVRLIKFSSFNVNVLNELTKSSELNPNLNILKTIIEGTHDSKLYYGGDNYKALMMAIIWQWLNSNFSMEFSNLTTQDFNDVTFFQNLGDFLKRSLNNGFVLGSPRLETRVDLEDDKVIIKQDLVEGFFTLGNVSKQEFGPFDPIILVNKAKLSALDDFCNLELMAYPALFFYYADEKGTEEFNNDMGETVLDVISVATGGGALLSGAKGIAKFVAVSDFVTSTINIANNVGGKPLPTELTTILTFINLSTSVVDLGTNLPKLLKNPAEFANVKMPDKTGALSAINKCFDINPLTMQEYLLHADGKKLLVYLKRLKAEASTNTALSDISSKIQALEAKWGKSIDELADAALASSANSAGYMSLVRSIGNAVRSTLVGIYEQATKTWKLATQDISKVVQSVPKGISSQPYDVLNIVIDDGAPFVLRAANETPVKVRMFEEGGVTKCAIEDGYCFTKGTKVRMVDGLTRPIESIKPGDKVATYNHKLGGRSFGLVKNVVSRKVNQLAKLVVGGLILWSTPDHPVFANGEYIAAKDLLPGDSVLTIENSYAYVDDLSIVDTTAFVYNFQVEGDENYYVTDKSLLVHNSCGWLTIKNAVQNQTTFRSFHNAVISAGLSIVERSALYEKIAPLTNRVDFINDFASDAAAIRKFGSDLGLVDAWLSVKTYHPYLAKDPSVLEAFDRLKKNPSLSKMNLTDVGIAKLQYYSTGTRQASYKRILEDLNTFGNFIENNPGTTIQNFDKVIGILQRTDNVGNNYKQGVHWMINDINVNGNLFSGKALKFEHSIPNARPTTTNSSIDLFCINCNPVNLKVEYKSGPGSMSSTTIKEQFIERDLFNASSLSEIQWRMDGTDFNPDKLKIWLKENRSSIMNIIEGTDPVKSSNFQRFFNMSEFDDVITDNHIDAFVDLNYNLIFK
ncbi:MAG: hypothetical protein EBR30_15960 [Cytophagia bacterium]|nr:hypothetical protein [Cytophagia bacterium]